MGKTLNAMLEECKEIPIYESLASPEAVLYYTSQAHRIQCKLHKDFQYHLFFMLLSDPKLIDEDIANSFGKFIDSENQIIEYFKFLIGKNYSFNELPFNLKSKIDVIADYHKTNRHSNVFYQNIPIIRNTTKNEVLKYLKTDPHLIYNVSKREIEEWELVELLLKMHPDKFYDVIFGHGFHLGSIGGKVQFLQSIIGSVKCSRCPDASQTFLFIKIAASSG